jgi:hypothetical protein
MNMTHGTEIIGGGSFHSLAKSGKDNHTGHKANKEEQPCLSLHLTGIRVVKIIKKRFSSTAGGIRK